MDLALLRQVSKSVSKRERAAKEGEHRPRKRFLEVKAAYFREDFGMIDDL